MTSSGPVGPPKQLRFRVISGTNLLRAIPLVLFLLVITYNHTLHRLRRSSRRTPSAAAASAASLSQPSPSPGPRIPNVVHFIFGMEKDFGHIKFGLMHYLALLATRLYVKPAVLNWHHLYLPANNSWWDCAAPLVSLSPVADVTHIHGKAYPDLHVAHKADAIRMQLMASVGGIYLDSDVIPLQSFEEVRRLGGAGAGQLVMGLEEAAGQTGLSNAVLVAPPNSSFINRWWGAYTTFNPKESWAYHSVLLPREIAAAHPEEIVVLSGKAFFAPPWTDLKSLYEADDGYSYRDNYAVHLWTSAETKGSNKLATLDVPGVFEGKGSFHRVARRVMHDAKKAGLLCEKGWKGYEALFDRPREKWLGRE